MSKNYWELQKDMEKIVPRLSKLSGKDVYTMKEKGRKSNYHQFDITSGEQVKLERLLDAENINSFAEVSLRAQSCPMPLNIDVWDGLKCPYACRYCFADYFRHSLYTSFFDNGKTLGLRNCAPEAYKAELDKLFKHRGEKLEGENETLNAVRLDIPMRLGIRFEDFPPVEKLKGVSLELLQYLGRNKYPVMINTKSDLPGEDSYLKALADNPAKAAIHFTLISSDETFLKGMEPGAPSFKKRIAAAKRLVEAGVRVVARIEPWMIFINDNKEQVDEYISQLKWAGIRHMTFDSYSYSAYSKGIAQNFHNIGLDFERMFLLSSDSQWLSSYLLGKFIEYFRQQGIEASTFDQGNVAYNDDWICCSVGDWFKDTAGFNWGSGVIAIKFIQSRKGQKTSWKDFVDFVETKGGFLSQSLKKQVQLLWNGEGDAAWPIYWAKGIEAVGHDEHGVLWAFNTSEYDYREALLENI